MVYANIAFDSLAELTPEELAVKSRAFICHTERILGAEAGSLEAPIMKIINS